MYEIVNIRNSLGLSQQEFSFLFHIPITTVRNWEQGRSNPPSYLVCMIKSLISYKIREDKTYGVVTKWKDLQTIYILS